MIYSPRSCIYGKGGETATYVVNAHAHILMLQIRAKHVLPATVISVLLFSLSIPVGLSLQSNTISSQGEISYGENKPWWGVFGTDWGWAPYGSFVSSYHINMLSNCNSNCLHMAISRETAWLLNDSNNALGIPFHDYVKQIVDWCHQADPYIYVIIMMQDEVWTPTMKANMMRNVGGARQVWIDWGIDMIQKCKPDALQIIDEPLGPNQMVEEGFTQAEYRAFCIDCINQFRAVDPNLGIWVYPMPYTYFTEPGGFSDNPLENDGYSNIVYITNVGGYYAARSRDWENAYASATTEQELDNARQLYYDFLDWRWGNLLGSKQICLIAGVASHLGESALPNYEHYLIDSMDYCIENNMYYNLYGFNKQMYTALNADHTDWNFVGQVFVDNHPFVGGAPPP